VNARASVAARVAGVLGALGYLSGAVDGPLIGAVAGLALITFGRGLIAGRSEVLGAAAFAVIVGATGAVALRWGTLDIADIRGIQAVLGPSVAVDPSQVAVWMGASMAVSGVALGIWLTEPGPSDSDPRWLWWIEGLCAAILLGTLFAGPAFSEPKNVAICLGSTLAIGTVAVVAHRTLGARTTTFLYLILGVCAAVVAVTAGVSGALA
jgi:hypothetical protein